MAKPPTRYDWGRDALEQSFDRDADRRLTRPVQPSTSSVPGRCGACGHWGVRTRDVCASCGLPWAPQAIVGPARG